MPLTAEQIARLQPLIVTNFSGSHADQQLANFSFLRVGIPLEKVTAANSLLDTKVLDFLRYLTGEKISKALSELRQEYPDNDDLDSAINDILKELEPERPQQPIEELPPPTRRLLLANGKMDARFAPEVKRYLQDVMEGWEITGAWETGPLTPADIDRNPIVIALLANFGTQKGVTDPPLSMVQLALDRLTPPRRVVLLSLTRGALQWAQERIQTLNFRDVVDSEPFFSETDGSPIFFGGSSRDAEVAFRVTNIGMKLSSLYAQAGDQNGAYLIASTTGHQPAVPIIVLGEPEGLSPPEAKASIEGLITALKKSGIGYNYWEDGWRNADLKPSSLLAKDPIFIRTVGAAETNTAQVTLDLERSLRSAFDYETVIDLLSGCRRVLWRPEGPPWKLGNDANIETRIGQPDRFVKWLERFVAPDAVVFHEALGEQRPAGLIRMLRETIVESLSVPNRKAFVRLRAFKELPDLGDDPLTIVAIDDLPVAAGIDLREKLKSRFNQFRDKINRTLEQKPYETDDPAIIRIAILTQGAALFQGNSSDQSNILRDWNALRVVSADLSDFQADPDDKNALGALMQQLIKGDHPCKPKQ
ncbi:hypothetical protein [Mesorhizobium sp. M0036]|uniref:hypothetical protein n=1 Tax=Mesorhizobium sp. M0036 TaxID=2956853 RepID=UPI00333A8C78